MSWNSKLQDWVSLLVHWVIRRRHPGRIMLGSGMALAATSLTGGWTFGVRGSAGALHLAGFASTNDGLPETLLIVVLFSGLSLALAGVGLMLFDWRSSRKAAERAAIVVVELRGLADTSDSSLLNSVPRGLTGQRLDALIDVRELATAGAIRHAMQKIVAVPDLIRRLRGSRPRSDVKVVVGGVLQVPLLFLAGVMLDDEGRVLPFDWDRVTEVWKSLDEPDDGERFELSGMDELPNGSHHVVLAVSASYLTDVSAVKDTFGEVPVVSLSLASPLPGSLWSGAKQDALAAQFTAAVATLGNKGVRRVSLVLAASSTLSLRLGRAYDRRNMPEIACYQYERKLRPAYPWSVLIRPSDVELVKTSSEEVAC